MKPAQHLRTRIPFPAPGGRSGRQGFTMVEIALCLGVIAIALVAIIGVLPTGLRVQQENRQDTVLAQDGMQLLEAIRSGRSVDDPLDPVRTRSPEWPNGLDYLTNHIVAIAITNSADGNLIFVNPFLSRPDEALPFGRVRSQGGIATTYRRDLTNGLHMVGLLGRQQLEVRGGELITNYVAALVRSLSGAALEKRPQDPALDIAFTYLLTSEVRPYGQVADEWINFLAPALTDQEIAERKRRFLFAVNQGGNLSELRLALSATAVLDPNFSEVRLILTGPVHPMRRDGQMRWETRGVPRAFRTVIGGRQFSYEVQDDDQFIVSYFLPGAYRRMVP